MTLKGGGGWGVPCLTERGAPLHPPLLELRGVCLARFNDKRYLVQRGGGGGGGVLRAVHAVSTAARYLVEGDGGTRVLPVADHNLRAAKRIGVATAVKHD